MVLKIAHRGASQYALENSIEAFQKALDLGVDIIEFDIHYSKDRKIVVIHDETVDRVYDGTGFVKDYIFDELRQFRGSSNEIIPSLEEVLELLKGKCVCKIDIKDDNMEEDVLALVEKLGIESSVILTAFPELYLSLARSKQLNPNILIEAGGFEKKYTPDEMIKSAKEIGAFIIAPHYSLVSSELIEKAKENDISIHVWVVNDADLVAKMKELGVDGITSNCPDII